jgi:hypothetical protein
MPNEKVDAPGVVPAIRTVECEPSNPKDQKRAKSEVPLTRPAPGRLPARASQT